MATKPTLFTFAARSGETIRARPLLPEDAPYLVDLFENMGADSRYHRFLQTVENVEMERVWSEAERIASGTAVDSRGFIAFCDMAERPNVPVGAVRFVRLDSGDAELAISVRDDMQGKGIGTELMLMLVDEAEFEGVERLVAVVQNDNAGVWAILRKLERPMDRVSDGSSTEVVIHLGQKLYEQDALAGRAFPEAFDEMDAAADYLPEPQFVG